MGGLWKTRVEQNEVFGETIQTQHALKPVDS